MVIEERNIWQKISEIRKQVEVMKKDKKAYTGYYVTDSAILAKITGLMRKNKLTLYPKIVPKSVIMEPIHYTKTRSTKSGEIYEENVNEILVQGDTVWTWVNDDNPAETIEVPWAFTGQQGDASQAMGSGLTYSRRYFLLQFFSVATPDDDPDKWRSDQKKSELEADKLVAEEIIGTLDGLVREFLTSKPEKKDEVKALMTKYAKNGDYRAITASALAGKLLNEFKETFGIEE